MIEIRCGCGKEWTEPESAVGKKLRCAECREVLQLIAGETLAAGAGLGDFDAALVADGGPELGVKRFLLGGVAEIQIGKLADRQIVLAGQQVSRQHCKLVRVDFEPSRWKIVDNKSTNGLFVNQRRVAEKELEDGDTIDIGEFVFVYSVQSAGRSARAGYGAAETKPAQAAGGHGAAKGVSFAGAGALTGGPVCPSCEKSLGLGAKICVGCGINVKTGRPLLTRQGIDENSLYETAGQLIHLISWLVWVTPMPMPLRSEAFGEKKPYAIWTIAILTILASGAFFIAQSSGTGSGLGQAPGRDLMLWSPWALRFGDEVLDPRVVHEVVRKTTQEEMQELREARDPDGKLTDEELMEQALREEIDATSGEFHWYQLFTHMFLHDTSSILNFAMHLGGNLLFMLVFGTRVNALIGNIACAILYPILGVCAALAHCLAMSGHPAVPMLGASGAIMGLAGMYLILFPVHNVISAMWIRVRWRVYYKIFPVRGFWVLLIYFGYDVLMEAISAYNGHDGGGGVAHWAHIGGFSTGMILGMGLLLSRQFNTNGGDLLSVVLGKNAWPLIGKPSRWAIKKQKAMLPAAIRL